MARSPDRFPLDSAAAPSRPPIAVVGFAGLFPGAATLDAFWSNIVGTVDAAREVPPGRWPVEPEQLLTSSPAPPGRLYSTRACFLDPFDLGAGASLELSDVPVSRLDPLVRLVLRVGAEAWADASTSALDRARVSVVLANIALPTEAGADLTREVLGRPLAERAFGSARALEGGDLGTHPLNRWVCGLPAGLLARGLGLGGGSYTLDAACASSLYALHLACEDLVAGRVDAVLAGGASRPDCLYTQAGFSQLRALSKVGRCSPFDARADGLVVGEGAGVFVLKRLDDALAQGDHIHALIRGVGLSNDVGGSLLAPDTEGQQRAMRQAYERAGWTPADVDLVECHGTGTPAGDGIELASLSSVFGDAGAVVGSVKSNVGHLLTAAGAAGFAKTLLALRHATLPPSANFDPSSALPALAGSSFEVLTEARAWPDPGRPRRAAVSGFGFGGINAHLLVEEWRPESRDRSSAVPVSLAAPATRARPEPIAIVGMGARFGSLGSLAEFGAAVLGGRPALRARPAGRWKGVEDSAWLDDLGDAGRDMPGAWIERLEVEVGRFKVPPREIPNVLPQQMLMLQVAADAQDDCHASPVADAPRLRTGVVVGMGLDLETTSFHLGWGLRGWARRQAELAGIRLSPQDEDAWIDALEDSSGPKLDPSRTVGALGGIIASRIARELRLGGPSFAVSAEDASGLRCVEVAARMLQRGEVDSMIAGAVDLAGDVRSVLATDRVRPWSRSGVPRPFDRRGDGPVVGEGAAAVVLKRLSDAEQDGDRVYAVLRGFGAGADWDAALARAWGDADLDASSASFVEAAGSGVPSEDSEEIRALDRLLGPSEHPQCALGSVRAVIGDPGATAGMAGLVKTALALFTETLPPLPGFEQPVDGLAGDGSALHVPRDAQAWLRDRADGPRRAGVSARAVDGNRMHVVLEGVERAPDVFSQERAAPTGPRDSAVFVLDGDREREDLRRFLGEQRDAGVEEIAVRWYRARGGRGTRAIAAASTAEVLRRLDRPGRPTPRLDGRVGWVFPGSGSHYLGMGQSLLAAFPDVARELDQSATLLRSQLAVDVFGPWRADWSGDWEADARDRLHRETRRVIFGQVAHGISVGAALSRFGLRPDAVIGYSLGESAGLFASGAWTDRDGMYDRVVSSPLFDDQLVGACTVAAEAYGSQDPDWVAVVVDAPAARVREAITGTVRLLIVNAPGECILGGRRDEVLAVAEALGCSTAVPLEGVPTVHCDLVDPVADAYRALHLQPTTAPAGVSFYSGNLGRSYALDRGSAADSIVGNATRGLDFQATIEQAWADGVRIFVEGGPQGSCTRMIDRILGDRPHVAVSACQRGVDGGLAVLRCVARLIEAGVDVDLEPHYGARSGVWLPDRPASSRATVPIELGGAPRPTPAPPRSAPAPSPPPLPSRREVPSVATTPLFAAVPAGALGQLDSLVAGTLGVAEATATAHGQFLAVADNHRALTEQVAGLLMTLQSSTPTSAPATSWVLPEVVAAPPSPPPAFDRDLCMEFAVGAIGKVLGPAFAEVDSHPTRVRLPDEPLMLVDRIIEVEGEPGTLGSGRVVTEHDVHPGAWYLDGGRVPVCISVEAGQADLFLSAYLGIDLRTKGERVYRLLDAEVTFWRDLPAVSDVIRYDIHISRFIRQGSTHLFFFGFDGWIGDEHLITMRDGCAGFFSMDQLESGRGLVEEDPTDAGPRRTGTAPFAPLVPMRHQVLDDSQLDALRTGDLEAAFGHEFAGRTLAPSLRLPDGRMRLIHRVTELDPDGGSYGRGRIVAETDVDPRGWYLTCHFVDDMVMPGTLMYEGCLHTLRVLLLRLGWTVPEAGDDVHYAPIPGRASALRCRGQVLDTTKTITYRIDIRELGYDPEPYVLADAVMFADSRKVVRFRDVSYRIVGLDAAALQAQWATGLPSPAPRTPVYDKASILAFCEGNPSDAFGPPYAIYDDGTRLARLPRPPLCFMDRIMSVGQEPWVMKPGGWTEGEWEVDPDAWFFAANRTRSMPFAVILEAALQPCGWLAAYLGSCLRGEGLYFRNLQGSATLLEDVRPDIGCLTQRTRLTTVSEAGGLIIQGFEMQLLAGDRLIYDGNTRFGFFPPEAMAAQVGLRDAEGRMWTPERPGESIELSFVAPADPVEAAALGTPQVERADLPARAFAMIDRVDSWLPDGGPAGLGWIEGSFDVDPGSWFFQAHFFGDPVIPGSLGLESFLQLMKVLMDRRWPDLNRTHRWEPIAVGRRHDWIYRGQVVPSNDRVVVRAWVDAVEDGPAPVLIASGFLIADGKTIYEMRKFALRAVPVEDA